MKGLKNLPTLLCALTFAVVFTTTGCSSDMIAGPDLDSETVFVDGGGGDHNTETGTGNKGGDHNTETGTGNNAADGGGGDHNTETGTGNNAADGGGGDHNTERENGAVGGGGDHNTEKGN